MEYAGIKVDEGNANFVFTRLTLSSTTSEETPFKLWVLKDNAGRELQLTSRSLKESTAWAASVKSWTFSGVALIGYMYATNQICERNLYGLLGLGGGIGMLATTWANHRRDEIKKEIIYRVSKNLDILIELIEKKADYDLDVDFENPGDLWPKVGMGLLDMSLNHSLPHDKGVTKKMKELTDLVKHNGKPSYGTYMGQPVHAKERAEEVWKALLGEEQSRKVWLGEKMVAALRGAEAGHARLNTYAWCSLGLLGCATIVGCLFSKLPRPPVSLSVAFGFNRVVIEGVRLWQSHAYSRLTAEAEGRIKEHRDLLINVAKGELRNQLVQFIKDEKLVDDQLLTRDVKWTKQRNFRPSTARSTWVDPVRFELLVLNIVNANQPA